MIRHAMVSFIIQQRETGLVPEDDAESSLRLVIPTVTREQMIEVDRAMVEELGISLVQMMENAGLQLARLAVERYNPSSVLVLAGSGGNGGGGLAAARRLTTWGLDVRVAVTRPKLSGVPGQQLASVRSLGIAVGNLGGADLIIDAVIGYGLDGPARGVAETFIYWANDESIPVLSLDTPSGVDVDTGLAAGAGMRADCTLTLALPKVGLMDNPYAGELFVADISVPPSLYDRFGLNVDPGLFRSGATQPVDPGR